VKDPESNFPPSWFPLRSRVRREFIVGQALLSELMALLERFKELRLGGIYPNRKKKEAFINVITLGLLFLGSWHFFYGIQSRGWKLEVVIPD
jgi:hypothetical protein